MGAMARRHVAPVLLAALLVAGCHASSSATTSRSMPSTSSVPVPAPTTRSTSPPHAAARRARVLLIGDSILDQEGSAAAFLLRQAGVDAEAIGVWGSGIIGIDQYDYGKTKPAGYWLHRAQQEIATFDPDVVGVYMNHSYWPPYPHDASGNPITDLSSPSGQTMIGQQARALITILRARHAKVFFITPAPGATSGDADPSASNAIWRGYVPVLHAMHVMIADTARRIETADGLRAETEPSCTGAQEQVRPPGDVHLTRFGAGLSGSALAAFVAGLVHVDLHGNAAPGDAVAAVVPTPSGRGYWLVGCDGSVFHFGDARPLAGAGVAMTGHGGAVAAVASPSGAGVWLVAADGTIASAGTTRAPAFARRPDAPVVAATAVPGHDGLLAITASGEVLTAGSARAYGRAATPDIIGITATADGRGYWLAGRDGRVFAFGDARSYGSAAQLHLAEAIAGIAATPDGRGYWLVGSDGGVFAFGDARFRGAGIWHPPPGPHGADVAAPGPTIGIVAAPGRAQGYWAFGTTGRVVGLGSAGQYGGDNNLALLTQ